MSTVFQSGSQRRFGYPPTHGSLSQTGSELLQSAIHQLGCQMVGLAQDVGMVLEDRAIDTHHTNFGEMEIYWASLF